jgi:hypothetical protein
VTPQRWPLAILLDLAEQKEGAAAVALAEALGAEGVRRLERDLAADTLRAHRAASDDAARRGPGCAAGLLAARALHLGRLRVEADRLAGALARREGALAAAAAEVARCMDARASARAAARALAQARDDWRAARRRERERAEEAAADEVVSARSRAGS